MIILPFLTTSPQSLVLCPDHTKHNKRASLPLLGRIRTAFNFTHVHSLFAGTIDNDTLIRLYPVIRLGESQTRERGKEENLGREGRRATRQNHTARSRSRQHKKHNGGNDGVLRELPRGLAKDGATDVVQQSPNRYFCRVRHHVLFRDPLSRSSIRPSI